MLPKFNQSTAVELVPAIEKIESDTMRQWAKQYLFGHFDHYNSVFEILSPYLNKPGEKKILDIGGVPAHMDAVLKNQGFDVEVADLNPTRVDGFLKAYNIVAHKVDIENETIPVSDNEYDIVLFNEILEHLRINPLKALEEIKRVLRPGGILLLSTPNITPHMRWNFFRGIDYIDDVVAEYGKLKTIGHMGHFRIYSETEVWRILRHFKFKVVKKNYGGKIDKVVGSKMNWLYRKLKKNLMYKQVYFVCTNEK